MPALSRGQENTTSIINWFITVNGVLTDAAEVGFRIMDIVGGLPGTQIFPATPGDYEEVTLAPGKFSTGSYFAYDNGNAQGWTPELTASIGTHRIHWRWKISAAAPYQESFEDFEVLVQSAGSTADHYVSIDDVRAEGLDAADYPDAVVLAAIETWQEVIDRACRQWFHPKALTLLIDGTDSDTIHFGVPIISIDHIKINNSDEALDSGLYKVYNGTRYPDDRRNPRIKLVGPSEYRDIYVAPLHIGRQLFRKGRQNQEVKGTFGYVEEDGSTPKLIKRALLKLVIEKLQMTLYTPPTAAPPSIPPLLAGVLIEEETDDHRRKYQNTSPTLSPRAAGLSGITADQEILDIIRLHRAPIGAATPANWSYF